MLYYSLALSLIALAVSNLVAYLGKKWVPLFGGIGIGLLSPMLFLFSSAVALQCLFLAGFFAGCLYLKCRPWVFPVLSVVATIAAYGLVGWLEYEGVIAEQQRFAYVSMENRLPVPEQKPLGDQLKPAAHKRFAELESRLEFDVYRSNHGIWARNEQLKQIHENTLQRFINSTGFGVTRMHEVRSAELRGGYPPDPIPQPAMRLSAEWSALPLKSEKNGVQQGDSELHSLHQASIVDFANVKGFGLFKNRRHVAGFVPHRFSQLPQTQKVWKLQMVELIGLVVHPKPVAYISEDLPRMDELRKAPTRSLDEFESKGLKSLLAGDDLFALDLPAGRRMLGAIRSAKQCVDCHGGKRGDLLGAFSYTLVKKPSFERD